MPFWEAYLEHEHLAFYPHSHIVFLRPSITYLLPSPDPLSIRDDFPDFTNTTHIFLPIYNNQVFPRSHWSLLLISVLDGVTLHRDSTPLGNSMLVDAQHATGTLSLPLGRRGLGTIRS
jgi:hypothetical protein